MNKRNKLAAIALSAVLATASLPFATACSGGESQSMCIVSYNLNYDDAGVKQTTVKYGQKARNWRAYREGYGLVGWYTDAECNNAYDFSKGVSDDCTLYAAWTPMQGYAEVTFDYGYVGRLNRTLALKTGEIVPAAAVPATTRMGMIFTGWYKDSERTQPWDIEKDAVTQDMTLYAGYETDLGWVVRNDDGSIKYDNEVIDVWCEGASDVDYEVFQKIVGDFNKLHEGKIEVKPSRVWTTDVQYKAAWRVKSTKSSLVDAWSNNHNVADIFSAAGVELAYSEFFENAIEDTSMKGLMKLVPFAAKVPYAMYNKTLMEKYWSCIGNKLPANYTELKTLLKAVYAGENASNAEFVSMVQSRWHFNELTSMLPFAQNGVDYFKYSPDSASGIYNDWKDEVANLSVKKAMEISYDLFGVNGSCHGSSNGETIINDVIAGKALFGIIGMSVGTSEQRIIDNAEKVGVMSLSGLFSDGTDENSKNLPVYTLGISFYNGAKNCSTTQLCASAEFAKYFTEHSYEFASKGLVPLNKKAYAEFEKDDSDIAKLLRDVANPDNFYTYTGAKYQVTVTGTTVAGNLVSFFDGDGTEVDKAVEKTRLDILAKLS